LYQPLKKYVSRLQLCGATGVFLAGAGPCLFILENNHARAENIYQQALDSGMSAIITETTTEPARPVVHQLLC
jgi:4-diphosphocytidyl-2C-methyl-D-erythritol kinase